MYSLASWSVWPSCDRASRAALRTNTSGLMVTGAEFVVEVAEVAVEAAETGEGVEAEDGGDARGVEDMEDGAE